MTGRPQREVERRRLEPTPECSDSSNSGASRSFSLFLAEWLWLIEGQLYGWQDPSEKTETEGEDDEKNKAVGGRV